MIFPRHRSLAPHSLNFMPILLCPMPRLLHPISFQCFPIKKHHPSASATLVPHALCRVVSHAPSLVSRHLLYHTVSCIALSLILPCLLYCPVSCIALSLVLPCLLYCPVSCIALSLVLPCLSYFS